MRATYQNQTAVVGFGLAHSFFPVTPLFSLEVKMYEPISFPMKRNVAPYRTA